MAKLTDTQLIVLSKAAAREDGLATVSDGLNKAAASKVAASLVSRKLMREIRSKPDMPVWREDEEGRGTSLVITRAGQDAIGIKDGENDGSGEAATAKNGPPEKHLALTRHVYNNMIHTESAKRSLPADSGSKGEGLS